MRSAEAGPAETVRVADPHIALRIPLHLSWRSPFAAWSRIARTAIPAALGLSTLVAIAWTLQTSAKPAHSMAIMLALSASACISSVIGFAFSAIAGAAVYHLVDAPVEAVRLMLWCSIAIQLYAVLHLRSFIQWRRLVPYLAGGFVTVGPFCWLMLHLSAGLYLAAIGVFLIAYAVYMLLRKPLVLQVGERTALALDVLTGAVGGMTAPFAAFPGLAISIWCGMRGWDKVRQRATYQPFILVMQVATLVTMTVMRGADDLGPTGAAYAIPAVLGSYIGLVLFEKLSNQQFNRLLYALLIVSGISMVLK
jgi:uncharacterized membrane protein YfcA